VPVRSRCNNCIPSEFRKATRLADSAASVSVSRVSRAVIYAAGSPLLPPSWYWHGSEEVRHCEHVGLDRSLADQSVGDSEVGSTHSFRSHLHFFERQLSHAIALSCSWDTTLIKDRRSKGAYIPFSDGCEVSWDRVELELRKTCARWPVLIVVGKKPTRSRSHIFC
jgi:hypothetical protein